METTGPRVLLASILAGTCLGVVYSTLVALFWSVSYLPVYFVFNTVFGVIAGLIGGLVVATLLRIVTRKEQSVWRLWRTAVVVAPGVLVVGVLWFLVTWPFDDPGWVVPTSASLVVVIFGLAYWLGVRRAAVASPSVSVHQPIG